MSFLFPAMLAGLAMLAVPIVLHLIARQRFPIQPIPNIRLLQTEQRTNAFAVRPVDLVQLILRLLVVAAVVFAVSRPVVWSGLGRSARNIVVVLDCSPSMLIAPGDGASQNLFDGARAKAVELLQAAGPHDEVAYIEAGAAARVVVPLMGDPAAAVNAVQAARVQFRGGSSISAAVAQGCTLLASRREVISEIYVLSDMRRNLLDGWDARSQAVFAKVHEKLGDRLKLRFIDFAPEQVQNAGIVDVALSPGRISIGTDAHLAATVRNVSDEEREVSVNLAVRRAVKSRRTVKVPPQSEAVVDLPVGFDAPVNTYCRLELAPPDVLAADDSFTVPIRLDRRFEVLIIDGSEPKHDEAAAATGLGSAAASDAGKPAGLTGVRMLEFALNPAQFAGEGRGRTRNSAVKTVSVSAVKTAILGTSNLIVLHNVSRLPQQTLDDLREFVRSGRSVMIVPGNDVNLIDLRTQFMAGKDAIPLCPADVDNPVKIEPGTKVSLGGTVHPVMEPFTDLRKGDLGSIRFRQLRGLKPLAGASVVFRVGELPAVVEMNVPVPGDTPEQRARRGRICVLAFGLEPEWSNLAVTRVFVPLIWRLTDHLAGRLGALPVDVVRSGERLALDCSDFVPSPTVALISPDGKPLKGADGWPVELPLSDSGAAVVSGLADVGAYEVTAQGQLEIDLKLADGKSVSGSAWTAAVVDATRGRARSIVIRGPGSTQTFSRSDAAGKDFGDAITIKNVKIRLAGGGEVSGDVSASKLDAALACKTRSLPVAAGGNVRTLADADVAGGRFADAVDLDGPAAAGRKSRFVGVNPPAGETDTTPVSRETIAAAFGASGWEIVPAAKAVLSDIRAGELWYGVAILLMLAYFAEGTIGHWLSHRRESMR
ncbi:MAG TPA: VWA domain-containing protein [Planctomycetota bacterium]|nr:VWA domain-containing protein [Planctomycetota bacterium]